MKACRTCKKIINDYPCPHCDDEGDSVFIGKEGGTGPRPRPGPGPGPGG